MTEFNDIINQDIIYQSLFDGLKMFGNSIWEFAKTPAFEIANIKVPYLIPITILIIVSLIGNKKLKKIFN